MKRAITFIAVLFLCGFVVTDDAACLKEIAAELVE